MRERGGCVAVDQDDVPAAFPTRAFRATHHVATAAILIAFLSGCGDDKPSGSAAGDPSPVPATATSASTVPPTGCTSGPPTATQTANPDEGTLRGHLYGVGGPAPGVHEP